MNPSSTLVNKLWRLCAVLRKDGITYHQFVNELTYLLFLKMVHERKEDVKRITRGCRWSDILKAKGGERLKLYKLIHTRLSKAKDASVRAIFVGGSSVIRSSANLDSLIEAIDKLDWFSEDRDAFGDLYEGLLQKNSEETKRGAGQYFTPRALIDVIVQLMQPAEGERIQDPAAGTGGFLIAANLAARRVKKKGSYKTQKTSNTSIATQLCGLENVPDTYRLLLMNLYLHGIDSHAVKLGDTLSKTGASAILKNANLILTNPPFGSAGGPPTRSDLPIAGGVSSYQLPFVEHCFRALSENGRAAIVVPDNVLFEDGKGKSLRTELMDKCNLHTILKLPTGIFYAQGVKTNVLFFQRGKKTQDVWIYDLRANMPAFGKTNTISPSDFDDFVKSYGADPNGGSQRSNKGEEGRFRSFTRTEIAKRNDNLDISWLRDTEAEAENDLKDPEDITAAIIFHLKAALAEIEAVSVELSGVEN